MNPLLKNKTVLENVRKEQNEFKLKLNAMQPDEFRFYIVDDVGNHRGTLYQTPVGKGFLNVDIVDGEINSIRAYLYQACVVNVPVHSVTVLNVMRHFVLKSKVDPREMFNVTHFRYFLREMFGTIRPVESPVGSECDYLLFDTPILDGFRGSFKMWLAKEGDNNVIAFKARIHVNTDSERVVELPPVLMPGNTLMVKLEALGDAKVNEYIDKVKEGELLDREYHWEMANHSHVTPESYAMRREIVLECEGDDGVEPVRKVINMLEDKS